MAVMMCCCCNAWERGSGPHLLFVSGWRAVVAGYLCPECVEKKRKADLAIGLDPERTTGDAAQKYKAYALED